MTADKTLSSVEVMAKEVGRLLWHNDPERPFTDEAWAREVKWWNEAKSPNPIEDVSYAHFADKCFRIARALPLALAECDFYVPEQIIGELAEVNGEVVKVNTTISPYASITVFRNLLRSIASGEK